MSRKEGERAKGPDDAAVHYLLGQLASMRAQAWMARRAAAQLPPPANPIGETHSEVVALLGGHERAKPLLTAFGRHMAGRTVAIDPVTRQSLMYPVDVAPFVLQHRPAAPTST
jgi:hypothetical protein